MYREAIDDYTQAIAQQFGSMTILLSLEQIRGLYPEFAAIPDEDLIHRINTQFWPAMSHADLSETLLHKNGKWAISLLNDLYEKRGDAYLRAHDFPHGVMDLRRIFEGIPAFAPSTDRWRSISRTKGEEKFLDVRTVELLSKGKGKFSTARFWLKTVTKKSTVIQSCEFDVTGRRFRIGSTCLSGKRA
jgi:hypothetical protein